LDLITDQLDELELVDRYSYAGQRWGLRCRCDFSNLGAVRFMYRYV